MKTNNNNRYLKFCCYIGILIFVGCAEKTLVGKYTSRGDIGTYTINRDSTFFFESNQFHFYHYSSGTWKGLRSKYIVLNSKIKNNIIPFKIDKIDMTEEQSREKYLMLNIDIPQQKIENYKCSIYVDDIFLNTKRCDSLAGIKLSFPLKNLYLKIYKRPLYITDFRFEEDPVLTEKFSSTSWPKNNYRLTAILNDSLFSYKIFNSDTFKIRKNTLIKVK